MANKKLNKQALGAGFTVVELLIATAVFSVVLLVFLSAFIQISQLFYKGVNLSNTQETARNVLQNISDDIRFSGTGAVTYPAEKYFCIGSHRYMYNLGVQYTGSGDYGIFKEKTGCASPSVQARNANNGEELLDPGMQVNKLDVDCSIQPCTVAIHIVYYGGDSKVFKTGLAGYTVDTAYQAPDAQCTGPTSGSQYCATATYKSTVLQNF